MTPSIELGATDAGFSVQLHQDYTEICLRLSCRATLDVLFLCFLQRLSRFGYFTLGPITIDVNLIQDVVERTAIPDKAPDHFADEVPTNGEDYVRFSILLMQMVRQSGRKRIDELHYLLAFMRCNEGLPGRVFGELGVEPEAIEAYLKQTGGAASQPRDQLMTPEEVAEYLRVNVQTVRSWIRSGRLPARRVAGLRALRVRFADVTDLLKPLDEPD